jgi:NAD(P)-dependent dehydrogenase (short-subunit alcohol dehydrogenase family)
VTRQRLTERLVLVTGAAQGLGLGIARHLASEGARVFLSDRHPSVVQRAAEPVFETQASAAVVDLANADSMLSLVRRAVEEFGELNGLVNCAAWSFHKPVAETTVSEFDRVVAINQRAPFFLAQQFVAQLTPLTPDPCIVNIGSVNAVVGNASLAAYSATKGALMAMTRALAVEYAGRTRVVAISPGAVRTDFTETMIQRGEIDVEKMLSRFLIHRFTTVGEIAELVGFLFSSGGACATGSNWILDGGYTAQ